MEELVLLCYDALTVMIPTVVLSLLFYRKKKNHDYCVSRWWLMLVILFGLYLFGMFHITGAGTLYDAIRYGLDLNSNQINLIPFSSDMMEPFVFLTHTVLNIVLFLPFGFLAPLLWDRYEKPWRLIIAGFLVIALIEFSQLLNHRSTDIDDVILNICGTICGVLVFKLIFRYKKLNLSGRIDGKTEMMILVMVTFLCHFLAFDEMGAARMLYGF